MHLRCLEHWFAPQVPRPPVPLPFNNHPMEAFVACRKTATTTHPMTVGDAPTNLIVRIGPGDGLDGVIAAAKTLGVVLGEIGVSLDI